MLQTTMYYTGFQFKEHYRKRIEGIRINSEEYLISRSNVRKGKIL